MNTLTIKKLPFSLVFAIVCASMAAQTVTMNARQPQRVTAKLDITNTHQRITGFGGFVCSPQGRRVNASRQGVMIRSGKKYIEPRK